MPAFSDAIAWRVVPRNDWWSRPIFAIAVAKGRALAICSVDGRSASTGTPRMLVASSLPPMPTSITPMSTFSCVKISKAVAVSSSNSLALMSSLAFRERTFFSISWNRADETVFWLIEMQSHRSTRCGLVKRPCLIAGLLLLLRKLELL